MIEERFGTLDPVLRRTLEDINALGERTRASVQIASSEVPRLTKVIAELDAQGQRMLKTVERFGPVTAQEMGVASTEVPKLTTAIREVDEQGKVTLKTVELFGPVTQEAMEKSQQAIASIKKPIDDFGMAFDKVFAKVTAASIEYGNNLRDHLHPALIRTAEAMGLLGERTEEVEKNTKGLSTTAKQLGHYINELGKEVNAYGNDIARLTDETQRLLDLRIDVKTPFATEIEGLQRQLQQANADLLALGRRIPELGYEGYKQQQKVLTELIATIEQRIAALKQTAATATGGTTTTGPRPPSGPTGGTLTGPPAGSGGGSTFMGGTRPAGGGTPTTTVPVTTVQRGGATYNMVIQTQAQDAAQLVRDIVPLLRQADLSRRPLTG